MKDIFTIETFSKVLVVILILFICSASLLGLVVVFKRILYVACS